MALGKKKDEKATKTTVKKVSQSTKATAKKAEKNLFASAAELRNLDAKELQKNLAEAREDLLNKQKMLKANELPSTHVIRETRRQIARLKMILSEKEREDQETVRDSEKGKEKDE